MPSASGREGDRVRVEASPGADRSCQHLNLLLVRHPAPAAPIGLCYGRLDLPVQEGADVLRLAASLASRTIRRVWTSPAIRCRILADAIACGCGTAAMANKRLQELDFGAWEGRPWSEVSRSELDRWAAAPLTFAPPGGETGAALVARVGRFCDHLRQTGENAIVVTHGGPLRIMPALLRGEEPDLLAAAPPFGAVIALTLTTPPNR